ncbi:DUF2087 domain-containing protein [Ornithinibacillus halophilus]|uniref:Transcriptional regulator n=1 Tax=Ornithinibacillus halophilus TaxID=930117 RepID=A0A1M5HRT2_9BACI|nr:transcriptional regulator [Ornithinibacillus halophilus]
MEREELFWNASIDELKQGYVKNKDVFTCIVCGKAYQKGIIYPNGELLYEAEFAVKQHIRDQHGSMFHYLLQMNKKYTGLTDLQKEIISYFKAGMSDKEIVDEMDAGSTSTIRTHRFKLKEKEKQAKVFLTIMELLTEEREQQEEDPFIQIHKGATMVDERYAITEQEREKVLSTYFKNGLDGPLSQFPSKEKRKIIILQHLLTRFEANKEYTEKEVNHIIKSVFDDFVTIRRYFIEYGFMLRNRDGSKYWLNN